MHTSSSLGSDAEVVPRNGRDSSTCSAQAVNASVNSSSSRARNSSINVSSSTGNRAWSRFVSSCYQCRHQVARRQRADLQREVKKHVAAGAALYSDALKFYHGLDRMYAHGTVDHAVKYVDGKIHTNGLENFWALKHALSGTYEAVEPFHLFRYLDEPGVPRQRAVRHRRRPLHASDPAGGWSPARLPKPDREAVSRSGFACGDCGVATARSNTSERRRRSISLVALRLFSAWSRFYCAGCGWL